MPLNPGAMEESSPAVLYCYKCGRRTGGDARNCYYCGAPKHRVIRDARRCPFCDLPVRRKAVKCHNCGEYLDGRSQPQAQQPVQPQAPQQPAQPQVNYYIDKAIIGMPGGAPGTPGQPYPAGMQIPAGPGYPGGPGFPPGTQGNAQAAFALPHAAPRAIEAPQARMLEYEGSRGQGLGVRGQEIGAGGRGAGGRGQGSGAGGQEEVSENYAPTVIEAENQALPVRASELQPGGGNIVPAASAYQMAPMGFPQQAGQAGRGAAGEDAFAMQRAAAQEEFAPRLPAPAKKKKSKKKAVEEEDIIEGEIVDETEAVNWRNCSKCGTEISKDDNFCFHCGLPQSKASAQTASDRGQKTGSHLWLFLTLLCAGGSGWFYIQSLQNQSMLKWSWLSAGLGAFLGLTGVFRGRGFLGRLLCFLLAAALALYLALPWLPLPLK
ncbi:MAG: zinc ribbon domain-containing protein [Candidatus Sumerlaeota bacterium]|nr:zinc ribbon domain-containing protein [Candidatus Sumerlaeota bacterium]